MPAEALLLGLGNPILGDDGIGPALATAVAGRLAAVRERADLDVIEDCSAGGLELLEPLVGRRQVFLVDAIVTGRAAPGTLHRFTAEALTPTRHLAGPHDADLATALALGRRLGLDLPRDAAIAIFAIEIEPAWEFRGTLTPALQRAAPALAEAIAGAVRTALVATSAPRAGR